MIKKSEDIKFIDEDFGSMIDRCSTDALVKTTGGLVLGVLVSALFMKRRLWPVWLAMGFGLGCSYAGCERNIRSLTDTTENSQH